MLNKFIKYIIIIILTALSFSAAPIITSNGGQDNASISFNENNSAIITTITSTDEDDPFTHIYSIIGGDDYTDFNLNSNIFIDSIFKVFSISLFTIYIMYIDNY